MPNPVVTIDARRITDWRSFHGVFAEAFGFPDFYGGNMDAWIDCLSSLDAPSEGMTTIHCAPGGVVVLQIDHARDFARRCPEHWASLIECAAFVNWRLTHNKGDAVLALSFHK